MPFMIGAEFGQQKLTLGETILNGGYPIEALPYIQGDVAREPKNWGHWNNLGICHKYLGHYDEAITALRTALELGPNMAPVNHNLGLVYEETGQFDAALRHFVTATAWSSNENTQYALATALLRERKYEITPVIWEAARLGKRSAVYVPNLAVWRGEELSGKKILVLREGGFGDIFWLLRYLRPLKELGAHVTFHAFKSQESLLAHHRWIDRFMSEADGVDASQFDYQVPLWSVMWELRKCRPEVDWVPLGMDEPYIQVQVAPRPAGERPRVGIAWKAGEMLSVYRKMRGIQDEHLAPLKTLPVDWISLVKGETPDWCVSGLDGCETWLDTARVVAGLDMVIAADSSVFHLSAAMGKPTWVFTPLGSDWKFWHEENTSSWYPSVRLFRNSHAVSFKRVVDKLVQEVGDWVEQKHCCLVGEDK